MGNGARLRRLGKKEQWSLDINNKTGLNIAYDLELEPKIGPDALTKSLNYILHKYQCLNCCISNNEFFELPASSQVPLKIANKNDQQIRKATIDHEVNTPFDLATGPSLRMHFLPQTPGHSNRIIVSFSHVVVDGKGSLCIVADLICQLTDKPSPPFVKDSFYPILQPVEELLKEQPQKAQIAQQELTYLNDKLNLTTFDSVQQKTQSLFEAMPQALFNRIRDKAKQNGLSFTVLLAASLVLARFRYIDTQQSLDEGVSIDFSIMVDLRRYIKQPNSLIGSLSAPLKVALNIYKNDTLLLISQKIQEALANYQPESNTMTASVQQLKPLFSLSSIGVIDKVLESVRSDLVDVAVYSTIHAFFNVKYSIILGSMSYRKKTSLLYSWPSPAMRESEIEVMASLMESLYEN